MRLSAVLGGCNVVEARADLEADVAGVVCDSRQVLPGFAFVAVQGLTLDGNRFVSQAVARGAAVVVSSRKAEDHPSVPWVQVVDDREALAQAAANFYGHPAAKLHAVGITGTNGKTTTAYLVESVLKAAGHPAALFGTVEYKGPGFRMSAVRTTPEAPDLQALFKRVVDGGWKHAVMEVSSHAIELKRVSGLHFEIAVFTNLTRDHLDFHRDMRSYFLAKKRLFAGLDGVTPRVMVLNRDDPHHDELRAIAPSIVISYGLNPGADVYPTRYGLDGDANECNAVFHTPVGELNVRSRILGRPNLYNIGAAIGVGLGLGLPAEVIVQGIAQLQNVPGRFEQVRAGQPFRVIVDYAHTDDALERVLQAAREITDGRLLVVFGCGGDRDRTKRPLMGKAAANVSDLAIVTSDNPRSEDPLAIIREIETGMRQAGAVEGANYRVIPDRRDAIRDALAAARRGDTVVIAGKGHETSQAIGAQTLPFDDRVVARELLNELAAG